MITLSRSFRRLPTGLAAGLALLVAVMLPAQTRSDTGIVQGRVFNAKTGSALRNVTVSVIGTPLTDVTDDDGGYRLSGIPAGPVRLKADYLGFAPLAAAVVVSGGQVAQQDFQLQLDDVSQTAVKLDAFTVVADREMSAQAVALNERRHAANIKNVVAYDEYGDRSAENIGDFLRFLPGVGIDEPAQIAQSVTLRGLPALTTSIQVDGADVANARGNSREQSLLDIPVGNVSRVEVTKVPTPDMPASSLGGSLNLVRKSGFESRVPVFTYQAYFILDERDLSLKGGPRGPSNDLSPRYKQPSVEFSYLLPVNKTFALTFSASRTWRPKPMERGDYLDTQGDWNFNSGYQRLSTWQSLSQILYTWSGQAGADWKISPQDTLGANVQFRSISNNIMRVNFVANYGAGAAGNRTFTQGSSAGTGSITQASGANQATGADTVHATLKYTHREGDWKIEALGSFSTSKSFLDDIDDGHFNTADSTLTGLVLRGDGLGATDDTIPTRYSATRAGAPVNLYDGNNYVIGNPTSAQNTAQTDRLAGRLDFSRDFSHPLSLALRAGVAVDRAKRDRRSFLKTWVFTPNGSTSAAARTAANFDVFDTAFNATAPTIYGQPMGWISLTKLYDLSRAHPAWFVLNPALEQQNLAGNSSFLTETVSSAYLRGDARFFDRRLLLTGGLRVERTNDTGLGLLNDPSAQYQKDAAGKLILSGGAPVLITTDALARAKLRYVERGSRAARSYADWYPSLHATFNLTDKLLVRAAYARTLGRPDFGNIVPGATLSEPTVAQPTVTVNNTGLKPWTADNFDLSIESYQIKGGFGSVGVFQKNIKGFFGSATFDATPELLALYGLPDDPLYLNYDLTTEINAGDARITGYEFAYNQALTFLPHWARGLQVFASATKLTLSGSTLADFTGYSPSNYAGGINFVRARFYVKFTVTYQGVTRGPFVAASAANGIPDGTYTYQGKRLRYGLNAQYTFAKHFSLYASIANIGGFIGGNLRYSPTTPDYMKERRRQEFPATVQLGVKGQF